MGSDDRKNGSGSSGMLLLIDNGNGYCAFLFCRQSVQVP